MPPASQSMGSTCLYTILGIDREASEADIKKAYRRLALKWHPDKNTAGNKDEAEKRFKEISAAYEILSDSEKRKTYDKFGFAGLRGGSNSAARSGDNAARRSSSTFRYSSPRHTGFSSSFFDGNDDFFNFVFRDPEEIFREFFAEHINLMNSFMEPFANSPSNVRRAESTRPGLRQARHHAVRRANTTRFASDLGGPIFSSFMSSTNGGVGGLDGSLAQRFSFFSSSPNVTASILQSGSKFTFGSNGVYGTPQTKGTFRSTSTKFHDGKCVTTRKIIQDGVETVTVEENGVLKSKTVNGQRVAIMSA